MAENESPGDALADLPEPIEKRRSRFLPSLIWLVPLVAAIAGATLLFANWRSAGDKIEVSFQGAEGVEAGKTQVRYKEVVIGRVTAVNLSDDNARVIVHIELDRRAHGFSAIDARYWVVRSTHRPRRCVWTRHLAFRRLHRCRFRRQQRHEKSVHRRRGATSRFARQSGAHVFAA